jgi:hypothetical protein
VHAGTRFFDLPAVYAAGSSHRSDLAEDRQIAIAGHVQIKQNPAVRPGSGNQLSA